MPYISMQNIIRTAVKRKKPLMRELVKSAGGQNGLTFSIKTDMVEQADKFRVRALVTFDQAVSKEILSEVRKIGLKAVHNALAPIRRTGSLENSFQAKILTQNRQVVLYSDKHAASAIEEGFHRGGTIRKLMNWMDTKSEFAYMKESKKREVAFLIWRKIESGAEPGPSSTLLGLPPTGQRRYQFMERISELMENDINDMLVSIASAASEV